ncbi:hypothetical protein YQE_02044, partial [Dendroctonus ponderosae]
MVIPYIVLTVVTLSLNLALARLNPEPSIDPNCTSVRDLFANASSDFIQCAIDHSRPITLCADCVQEYLDVLNSYNNISKASDNGTSCLNSFVNLDRLGIVHTLYENSVNLWTRAKCYECFALANGTNTPIPSDISHVFQSLYQDFQDCVNRSREDDCTKCMDTYVKLQNYFLSISNENEKIGVCMDIVDLMNTTWTYWGGRCCKFRRHNEIVFITSTVLVLVATVLFYIVAQIYTKKRMPTIMERKLLTAYCNCE